MGEKAGNAIQSIRKSILRIAEQGYDQISGDAVIIATVTETFSDALDTETFGTMTCFDNKSKIEIDEIPLNAHICDDGSTALSGKYTFPKIGSDVYLLRDVDDVHERYICILFSHVESVIEIYNTSKTTKLVEVTTADSDESYETEETGKSLEVVETPLSSTTVVADVDGGLSSTTSQSVDVVATSLTDGSDTSSVEITPQGVENIAPEFSIDTGTAAVLESAVLGDTAIDLIGQILDAVQLITVTAAGSPSSVPINSSTFASIKSNLNAMLATNIKLR
tara:strand:- start:146 stop:982 length:837 start_codon:yes stop_codon:yes gene_type:complete